MTPILPILIGLAIGADDPLAVRLTRGQELVYRGKFTEESRGLKADRRSYNLEARAFFLEAGADGAEAAFLTVIREPGAASTAGSARFELATVNRLGRVALHATGSAPRIPLDGPPTLEPVGLIEFRVNPANVWDVADGGRPPREWRIVGEAFHGGVRCVKLIGEQESAEWQHPTGGAPGWRRSEVVWLAAATGIVRRLERTIERRAGADGSAEYSARTEYELAESSIFPERLADERRREIRQIAEINQKLTALMLPGTRPAPARFEMLLAQIDQIASQSAYGPALLALRHRVEAGSRGEVPPPDDAADPPTLPPALGRLAPDFVTTDLIGGANARLSRWRGRPAILLFVRPDGPAASPTLNLAADLQRRFADRLRVAVLVVSDEERARPAWTESQVPLFAGRNAAAMYGATGPSRVVVVDSDGVVRYLGDAGPGVIAAVQGVVSGN